MTQLTFIYAHIPGRGTRVNPSVSDYWDAASWLWRFSKLDEQGRRSEVKRWRSLARRRMYMNAVMRSRFVVKS